MGTPVIELIKEDKPILIRECVGCEEAEELLLTCMKQDYGVMSMTFAFNTTTLNWHYTFVLAKQQRAGGSIAVPSPSKVVLRGN